MSTDILDFDPYKRNAYSKECDLKLTSDVSFDIGHKDMSATTSSVFTEDEYNPLVSEKKTQSKEWELDVRSLISSKKWLQNYGLKKNKLSLFQILPTIGFKVADGFVMDAGNTYCAGEPDFIHPSNDEMYYDFDFSLKRPVSSRYGTGLFSQVFRSSDGKTFNVTCSRQQLRQLEGRLLQAIALYKRRLEWLTTESRRVFGVIEEKALTIVLDIRNMSPQQFDQYKIALEQVIFEQLTQVAKFNIIRATDDIQSYHEECIPVTYDTVQGAVDWLWSLDRLSSVSRSAAVEAVIRAISDKNNEAVYLFTEGTAIDSCKEIMKEKVLALKRKIPVHCVSYNCDSSDTVRFLRDFAASTGGKFHAYAVIMEMDSYEGQPLDPRTNKANIVLKKKTYGGIPPGAGMRDDVIDIFQEMEEARNSVAQIQALMEQVPEPKIQIESQIEKKVVEDTGEQYMGSREWLKRFGLTSRRLELFDVLAGVAFKHKDGVVDMKYRPEANTQTDAISRPKLLNAKYCDRFPVVRWKDGGVVHVQVTPELHRNYEQRMSIAVQAFNQRIDWLNQGSRALFGTVIEDQIYILIDTSSSMTPSIQFVKDKLFVLMQEQLRHKMKFNLIAFNSKATPWQNRMVEVGEQSLKGAWKWIQGLTCWGSTNTYAALQHALSDPGTQAVYLLTDGRPDQPPRSIIAQVQMQHCVPVHSISFNCNDTEANQFLCDLARATGGRYHYYSEKGKLDQDQPQSWESEDIRLLKEEINRGLESLDKIEELRDECSNLSWKKEVEDLKRCSRNHPLPEKDRVSSMPVMEPTDLYRSETPPLRPKSAPPDSPRMTPVPPSRPKTSRGRLSLSTDSGRPGIGRPFSASKQDKNSLSANKKRYGKIRLGYTKTGWSMSPRRQSHTRTSLLRTLNSSGHFSTDEWLLPETRQLFEKQAQRQKQLAIEERQKQYRITATKHRKGYRPKEMSSKMWLSKHGLIAKKLTILDALAPTFVPHKAKYVPILDKHVLAKVFDEVLPLAHVSGRSRKRITLVNPNAVDLRSYEEKVDRAVAKYEERLNKIVWQALPKSAQEQFESDEPISFRNNRLTLTKALETAGWPIKENDILLLEKEICRGEKFIQQSRELRKASDVKKRYSDGDLVKSRSDESLASSARDRRRSRSRESVSSDSSKSSHSTRSSKSSARRSHDSLNLDDQRKDVNINDDLNVYDDKASVVSSLSIKSNPSEVSRT